MEDAVSEIACEAIELERLKLCCHVTLVGSLATQTGCGLVIQVPSDHE